MRRIGNWLGISVMVVLTHGASSRLKAQFNDFDRGGPVVWVSPGQVALGLLLAGVAVAMGVGLLSWWSDKNLLGRYPPRIMGAALLLGVLAAALNVPITSAVASARHFRRCAPLDRTGATLDPAGANAAYAREGTTFTCGE